ARYKLTLGVPEDWDIIANGSLDSTANFGGLKTHFYKTTPPIPTYLFAFAAGKFEKVERELDGRKFVLYHREPDAQKLARNLDAIFDIHAQSYRFLEAYTGIENPWDDYEFLLVPDFQYGGMEHSGAIWYRDASLLLNADPTRNQELNRAHLIAHEVAHMWFGNLVTMRWFDDVWLKEVFANFMADKITQPDFQDINHTLLFLHSHFPSAYEVDRTAGTHPVQQNLDNLANAGSLYGAIIYKKAPILMKHLEARIGKDAMQRGLQEYLKTYAFGNATWDDLMAILSKASGENLDTWNRNWVKTAGMPKFEVENLPGKGQLKIKQTGAEVFQQNLQVDLYFPDSTKSYDILSDQREVTLDYKDAGTPAYIDLHGNPLSYGYTAHDPGNLKWLVGNVEQRADAAGRYAMWMTLWENFLHANVSPEDLLFPFREAITKENNPLMLRYVTARLQSVLGHFFPAETYGPVLIEFENRIWRRLELELEPGMRRLLWNTYSAIAGSPEALDRLYAIWEKTEKVPG
ncbi:MAG: M1 family aminopeptidase, partial [Bacteroidota bacterium]